MGIPQILMIILFSMSIGMSAVEHGKPKTGNNSVWSSVIGVAIEVALLWWGGFFG